MISNLSANQLLPGFGTPSPAVAPPVSSPVPGEGDAIPGVTAQDPATTDSNGDRQGVRDDAVNPAVRPVDRAPDDRELINGLTQAEVKLVRELSARDREVRAHEQAHASVGGRYAGSPTYTLERGPDGRQYAVGGEVSIDISPIAGDPQATIQKARIVRRAALAPAEPSAQDRAVAAEATSIEQQAQAELLAQQAASSTQDGAPDPRKQATDDESRREDAEIIQSYRRIDTRA